MTTIEIEERDVIAMLDRLARVKHEKSICETEERRLVDSVRQYMTLNYDRLDVGPDGNRELVDLEHRVRAFLQERRGPMTWDVSRMPDELVLWLAHHNLLTVVTKTFDSMKDSAPTSELDRAMQWRSPGEKGDAMALMVVRMEK